MSTDLRTAIMDVMSEQMRAAASKIADELTFTAMSAVAAFYSHYTPKYYRRKGGLIDVPKRYYRNPHNTIYHAGVELQPASGAHRLDNELIRDYAFEGYHGYVTNAISDPKIHYWHVPIHTIPPVMSPSPMEIIEKKRDEILAHINSYF